MSVSIAETCKFSGSAGPCVASGRRGLAGSSSAARAAIYQARKESGAQRQNQEVLEGAPSRQGAGPLGYGRGGVGGVLPEQRSKKRARAPRTGLL